MLTSTIPFIQKSEYSLKPIFLFISSINGHICCHCKLQANEMLNLQLPTKELLILLVLLISLQHKSEFFSFKGPMMVFIACVCNIRISYP